MNLLAKFWEWYDNQLYITRITIFIIAANIAFAIGYAIGRLVF